MLLNAIGLFGILIALGLLIWLAYRGWSVLVLAPAAAFVAATFSQQPLLAHWTQTFMGSATQFVMQFFPIFLRAAQPPNPLLVAFNRQRLPSLRKSIDAGANASVLPAFSVASLVGFGAVVAALPAFAMVRDWVLSIGGGPLVSLAVATNVLAALTGSASGGLTIALDALGATYMRIAAEAGIDPAIMHRVAVIGAGLDSLPHNGAVVTLLAVCGSTHRDSYFDIVMVAIVGALLALVAVIILGTMAGSF